MGSTWVAPQARVDVCPPGALCAVDSLGGARRTWYTGCMDDQNLYVAPSRDRTRQDATDNDTDFSLSLEEVAERYERAGLPRTLRSLQRYCANGHLDARKIATTTGDKYLVTPQSVARHIAQTVEFSQLDAVANGRDVSRPVATT